MRREPGTRILQEAGLATYAVDASTTMVLGNSVRMLRHILHPIVLMCSGARFLGARLEALYRMHRARVEARAWVTPIVPQRRDDPVAFQDREAGEIQDWWVAKGIYRYVDGDRMKLTPLGIFRSVPSGSVARGRLLTRLIPL